MIRNILFDLGGVLLDIDFERTFSAFAKLMSNHDSRLTTHDSRETAISDQTIQIKELFEHATIKKTIDLLETGKLSEDDFRTKMMEITGVQVSDEEFDAAWNALLLEFPEDHIRMVEVLSKEYRVFLLSNTNSIHCRYYNQLLKEQLGIASLGHLMEKAYYSFEMGLRKPDPLIFWMAMKKSDLKLEETLFLDDCEANIESAQKLGIKTELISKNNTVVDVFGEQRLYK